MNYLRLNWWLNKLNSNITFMEVAEFNKVGTICVQCSLRSRSGYAA